MKIGLLISDEVGGEQDFPKRIIKILQDAHITLHILGVPDSCHEEIARETGGKFWNINDWRGRMDFSAMLDSVASEITNLALR